MKFKTKAIHAGQGPDPLHGAVMTPVFQTSTFAYKEADQPPEFDYSRSGNPTRKALETCLAALEGGKRGFAFASGMAAEATLLLCFSAGDHFIVSDEMYGGTYRLFMDVLANKGFAVDLMDLRDLEAVEKAVRPETKLIWIETPTNPLMKLVDLEAVAGVAKRHGVLTVCDNTFLSPYFQNPLDFGIDVVVHSTTKYINGHSDIVGGALVLNDDELADKVYFHQNAAPWDCFLVLRGIKTLALRMQEHQRNALAIAAWLEAHPKIERVLHPGLESHPQYALARKQTRGDGGTFSIFVKGGPGAAHALLRHTALFSQAVSLGGVESLLEHPWSMTHAAMPEAARREMGISEDLIRLSIGIEDAADIQADLENALDHA